MGQTKEQEKKKSSQPRKSQARRKRYRERMLAIFRSKGDGAERLGRKLRRAAKEGRLS